MYNTGCCYANGEGVAIDKFAAFKYYKRAAEAGHVDAQTNLGVCYLNGTGVEVDKVKGVKWFRKAAESGNAELHVI
jgi:uncharacterized protein